MSIEQLNEQFGIDNIVTFTTGKGDLPCIEVKSPLATATVYLHGAHLTHWQPTGEEPVLFMNSASWFEDGKPIRGGVPICFPWFGPHLVDENMPAHGIVRVKAWDVESIAQDNAGNIVITLATESNDETYELWPFEFKTRFVITVGKTLSMSLQTQNTDDKELKITEALHSYFSVSDIHNVQVVGLEGRPYLDKVAGVDTHAPDGPLHFTGEFDSVFCDTQATCMIIDEAKNREISIAKQGSDATVVWNPWINKSKALPDMADNEWPQMLCVETVNAGHNIVTIKPGDTHAMTSIISVTKIK
ncbi:MAG TPA: D-hexose-6-phosphate mutarotase [Phycisphaerales bacterium]|nr:D-hexose-6-phosphate mutarotase [Phycisphaerales bacterium]|tara:strand:+ start:1229 stop:2134 length:906 start_codon:yes stop_codon:yes gene_type:complete